MQQQEISLEKFRILIVDDNEDVTTSLAMLIKSYRFTVQAVNSGKAALAILEEFMPHIILLDIGMPEMNGYEVAERIRQNLNYAHIKLFALTGWGQDRDRAKSLACGFDAHLIKPMDLGILKTLLLNSINLE